MCCTLLAENTGCKNDTKNRHLVAIGQKSPFGRHRTTLSGCIFTTKACIDNREKKLKQQYLLHMFPQHSELRPGPLAAEINWRVWGMPANFKGLRILALLLQRHHSTEANQTLHNVWPTPGLVHYLYIFGGCCPVMEFCQVQNSLCVLQVLHCPVLAALLHSTLAVGASQTLCH